MGLRYRSVTEYSKAGGSMGLTPSPADRPFTELQQRQAAFTHLHGYLNALAVDLAAEGVAHPVAEVHAAHNFPAFAHHAAYRVAHHATLTHAEKVAWAEAMLLGPIATLPPSLSGTNRSRGLPRLRGQRSQRRGLTLRLLCEVTVAVNAIPNVRVHLEQRRYPIFSLRTAHG